MTLKGTVIDSNIEERDLVGKDGNKKHLVVRRVLLSVKNGAKVEICNCRAYDTAFELPKPGAEWTTPPVRRYECFDGMVAEVSV